MPASLDPQLALDERAISNPDLESALERRLRAKDDVSEVRGVYKVAHKEVTRLVDTLDEFPADTALRVGRFRITKRHVDAKHVEFDAEARDQISIGLVDEDGKPARRSDRQKAAAAGNGRDPDSDDDEDLRPTGEVNADALRGEAQRSLLDEPTSIKGRRNGHDRQAPPPH